MNHKLNQMLSGCAAALAAAAVFCCSPAFAQKLEPQPIRTYSRLLKLLKERQSSEGPVFFSGVRPVFGDGLITFATASQGTPHSETLVQVAGVDEADQVKNDGTCIYQLNQNRVMIIRAHPANDLGIEASLDFTSGDFTPNGLYLDSRFLVVIGTANRNPIAWPIWRKWAGLFPYLQNSTVQAKVYDIANPKHPRKLREFEIDGDYVGTRKIGSTLYLVSRHYPQSYAMGFKTSAALTLATPGYRDSWFGKGFRALSPTCCYYLPGSYNRNFLVVAGIDLAKVFSTIKLNAYLGAGDQIYASADNLYVAASQRPVFWSIWNPLNQIARLAPGGTAAVVPALVPAIPQPPILQPQIEKTEIYKFSLAGGRPAFLAAAQVPGTILNSYAMDENDGYFRVATTVHSWFNVAQETNLVHVLDSNLNLVGKLENIAPGEQIYAARFIRNRLFLVTFRRMDPLFAIDLSDPANPVVAGELVLPGFSNFLLPFDGNHLIGLGKDVSDGGIEQGMKLALFDVSDLRNPALVSSVNIGDRGTCSMALQDAHALLFDPARRLLAFPLSVTEIASPDPMPWEYGVTTFQGAYVFSVSPETGFEFRGSVTHTPEGVAPCYDQNYEITRVLTIGSDLFTLSPNSVKANGLKTLAEKSRLDLRP